MNQTIISSEYLNAVKAIKQAILESRYRAARHVNKEWETMFLYIVAQIVGIPKLFQQSLKCYNRSYLDLQDSQKRT